MFPHFYPPRGLTFTELNGYNDPKKANSEVTGMEPILNYTCGTIQAQLERTKKILVQDVSIRLGSGESLALVGETGSGKTILAQSVMGVLPGNVRRVGGELSICGKEISGGKQLRAMLGKEIVYIPQNGYEFLNPSRTVRKHLYDSLVRIGVPAGRRDTFACEKLEQAGFPEPKSVMDKYPFQLSGGMAQRVTIALALCSHAKLLIADEPTNGLDEAAKERFMHLLGTLFPEAGKLVITHDISVAAMCDRILVLCRGRSMESGKAADVLTSPYHPYTKALLAALVENGMRQTPVLRKETGLCPFYRRCPQATVQCREALPKQEADSREWWCCMK